MDASRLVQVRENFIKILSDFAMEVKKSGRQPRIGVLVVRFSQIQALIKHALIIFTFYIFIAAILSILQ